MMGGLCEECKNKGCPKHNEYKLTDDFEAFSSRVDDLICDLEENKKDAITNIKTFIFEYYREMRANTIPPTNDNKPSNTTALRNNQDLKGGRK